MNLALAYGIFGILSILSAIGAYRQKRNVLTLLFTVTAAASALFTVSRVTAEPWASITGWTAITIAIATLAAFGLARLMPKDRGQH